MLTYRRSCEEMTGKRGRIRLLATDIDGTLLRVDHTLSGCVREGVLELERAGIPVVLATGRRYSQAYELAQRLELKTSLIAAGGAIIRDPWTHETRFRAKFEPDLLLQGLSTAMESGVTPYLYTDRFPEWPDVLAPWGISEEFCERYPECGEYFARNAASIAVIPECFGLESTGDVPGGPTDERVRQACREGIFTWFAVGTWDEMSALRDLLNGRFPGRFEMNVLRGPKYSGVFCEVLPAGIHKWSAVQRVARMSGIADDEICAVGDDVNDLRMFRGAGIGVAMGNAAEHVVAEADMVVPSNVADGICELFHWLVER
ncbi:MAG: HAD family hydrolase [Planctomycetia bacterium]|nr:HAD family hydrolase [Planctomycetia bacterium]